MKAYWFTVHEQGGFPVERAALGSCEFSVQAEAVAVKLLDPAP